MNRLKLRNSFLFISILFLALINTGCNNQYMAERVLHRASKMAKKIIVSPDTISPFEFNKAVEAYKTVFTKYPNTWCAKRARLGLGSLYLAKEKYKTARDVFEETLRLYPDDRDICLESQFALGKSYENEGEWESALIEYKKLIKEYPNTKIGLSLPIYIAQHFEKEKNVIEVQKAYIGAVAFYNKVAEKNRNNLLGFRAENLLVRCYIKLEDWEKALDSLRDLAMHYPMARSVGLTLRMVGDVSINRLKQPQKAAEIFKMFLEKFPEHPLKDKLKEGIEEIKNVISAK